MSMYAFYLQGWEDLSTWGRDDDLYYAQLTRNDASDDDGPQIQITPPSFVVHSVGELVHVIATAIAEKPDVVDDAMSRGLALDRGNWLPPAVPTGSVQQD